MAELSAQQPSWTNDEWDVFWNGLTESITKLDNVKYKPGLVPLNQESTFGKEARMQLQTDFEQLQRQCEEMYKCGKNKMPYTFADIENMRDFHEKSNVWNTAYGRRLAESDSPNDVASFVAKLGEENINMFTKDMKAMFPTCRVGAKTNVQRIAQKIEEIMKEENVPAKRAWMYLTDVVRLTVNAQSVEEVQSYRDLVLINNGIKINVMRFKPRFAGDLQDMIINFNWSCRSICEMQIKLGSVGPGYYDQHFVYECRRTVKAKDYGLFVDNLVRRCNFLRGEGRLTQNVKLPDDNKVNMMIMQAEQGYGKFEPDQSAIVNSLEKRQLEDAWVVDDNMEFFKGEWVVGKNVREGHGTKVNTDGTVYIGIWDDNKLTGKGRFIYPDGSVGAAEYRAGKPIGQHQRWFAPGKLRSEE